MAREKLTSAKYKVITKKCLVCSTEFEALEGHPKEQKLCSIACSNIHTKTKHKLIIRECLECGEEFKTRETGSSSARTCSVECADKYFKIGERNHQWKDGLSSKFYRKIAFQHHKKECILCGEDKIVAVHHHDENHFNNAPENLVPLCPTHHQYVHSSYHHLVSGKIQDFIDKYLKRVSETD